MKTNAFRLNFYHSITGVKHLPALLAKKKFSDDPHFLIFFFTFSVEPLVIYNCALYNYCRTIWAIFDF